MIKLRTSPKILKVMKGQTSVLFLGIVLFSLVASSKEVLKKDLGVEDELKFSAGDEQGNEMKALKAELLINRTDERALSQLKKLLHKYKGSALEPSLQFRLAELYMRKAKT